MKAKSKADRLSVRLVHMEILLALALLGVVFLTAAHSDTVSARQQMATTIQYIQEQCNRYNRIELASETKSLMRVMESVGHIARQMAADGEESAPLSEYAQMGYVSGLIVMDETGFVLSDYHGTGEAPRQLGEYLDSPALLDAALYPEKRYATRFACEDGSMIDLAAVGRRDAPGIVAAYYRTPVEYLDAFRLSIALMLSGYSPETSGTIVVTGGSRVVASNDETLIGGNAEEMAILRQIRQAYSSGELVRASWPEDSFRRYYGMMGCGRNFYVYVYMPEKTVFATTPQSMLFALIFYAVVLAFAKAVRFRTAQSYQERQYRVQKEYAEKLRAANAELSAAVDQADRANAAKTSFLSRMSHDIRTPLNGIIGLLQIDDAHPSDVALLTANREKMKVAANHLLSLINDVLQMSKLESGEITLAHEPLDLNRLLRDILTIVEQRAAEAGVAVGAHPGYPDLQGFGRRDIAMSPDEVYDYILYQIGALQAFCHAAGARMHHVKPHGQLYNRAAVDPELARAVAAAVHDANLDLVLVGLANSELIRAGQAEGIRTAQEFFADRNYTDEGLLVSRKLPDAVITDEDFAVARVVRAVKEGAIKSASGKLITVKPDTICIHGDNVHALEFAGKIRTALTEAGVEVKPV